ncbi:hypothetical protein [Agrobacterium tumefaciens]|uniref:hypothetical protein n=1 Tax=Agrobacterium tumefaciens TaxID=358 RepID=UPI001574E899|nr:hypothetical protein [Agrobacterium tumefaciens]NSX90142.1 hypothetical protein [Agrobacterium tumefaciens]
MQKFAVFFTACVFIGASAYSSAGQQQAQEQRQSNSQTESSEGGNFSIPIRIVPDPLHEQKAKADAEKSDRDEQRENDNLAIQRSVAQSSEEVAQWAAPMFYANVGALLLSLITVAASSFAAWFALGSVREARAATGVAQRTLASTEDTAIRQLRAYIVLDSAEIPSNLPTGMLYAVVTLKNFGQTPARFTHVGCVCLATQNLIGWGFPQLTINPYEVAIGAGGTVQFHAANTLITIPDLEHKVQTGQMQIGVSIFVRYLDIFDNPHEAQFTRTIETARSLHGGLAISPSFPDRID